MSRTTQFCPERGATRLRHSVLAGASAAVLAAGMMIALPAFASHPEVSLPGSTFEIDTDANLRVDDAAPSIDWANVAQTNKPDKTTGAQDDSFAGLSPWTTRRPAPVTTASRWPSRTRPSVRRHLGDGARPVAGHLHLHCGLDP